MNHKGSPALCYYLQIKSSTPVLLCSVTGYDASNRVDDLAAQQGKQCTSIAIGECERSNMNRVDCDISLFWWHYLPSSIHHDATFSLPVSLPFSFSFPLPPFLPTPSSPPFLFFLGSAEGFSLAEKAISSASKSGR